MCLYDLQKAFDSVEYPVLLEKLYDVGMNGKMWRLLKSWYKGGSCQVKVDGSVSDRFTVERGVKQGSVLSPTLFLLVMDPLLRQLQCLVSGKHHYFTGDIQSEKVPISKTFTSATCCFNDSSLLARVLISSACR